MPGRIKAACVEVGHVGVEQTALEGILIARDRRGFVVTMLPCVQKSARRPKPFYWTQQWPVLCRASCCWL
jgi:hypothetical protein